MSARGHAQHVWEEEGGFRLAGSQHRPDAWVSTMSPLSRGVSIALGRAALLEWRSP